MKQIINLIIFLFLFLQVSAQVNFTAPELIGRVTDRSATINVLADSDFLYYYKYGTESGVYNARIPNAGSYNSVANVPFEVSINSLSPNTRYYYRLVYSSDNGNTWIERDEHSFQTQRPKGRSFVFTITSDSHLKTGMGSGFLNLYTKTLENILNDNPDLHFDLGDTFGMDGIEMGDTISFGDEYLFQRKYLGIISHSIPIYLVIGNHEDEEGWNLDDTTDVRCSKPIMGTNARKKYFLNPVPDSFFTGNTNNSQTEINEDHLREDYYAFEWGDALFVVIDPFWNTMTKPYPGTTGGELDDEVTGNRWDWTLGEVQYLWLKQTLESSSAKWKFVFTHHVTGGTNLYGRGGAEATKDFEWGTTEADFIAHRPDWVYSKSIHQILLDNHATILFHGHDHLYAKENVDNMIYQECPQPNDISYSNGFGNYSNNDSTLVLNNSGHIRVNVTPNEVTVDYIRAYLPASGENGKVEHSYTIQATAGIKENSYSRNINIYPNPSIGMVNISSSSVPIKEIKISDAVGNLLAACDNVNNTSHRINLDSFQPGIYFINISTSEHTVTKRIVLLNK